MPVMLNVITQCNLFLASNSVTTVSPAFFLIQHAKTCNCRFHWSRSNRTWRLCGLHV